MLYFCNYLLWWSFWKLLENVCSLIRIIIAPTLRTILFDLWDWDGWESSTEFVAHVLCINCCVCICYLLSVQLSSATRFLLFCVHFHNMRLNIDKLVLRSKHLLSTGFCSLSLTHFFLFLFKLSTSALFSLSKPSTSSIHRKFIHFNIKPESLLVFLVGYSA